MSCSRARRELLDHLVLGEELGSRSAPHLAHLESCAECRREVGVDRELVANLRRALQERIEGHAPTRASWSLIRRRTIDRPARPGIRHALPLGGMASAAAVGVMMFAVATAPIQTFGHGAPSPYLASAATRGVPPESEAHGWPTASTTAPDAQEKFPPLPGWPTHPDLSADVVRPGSGPTLPGRMREPSAP